MKIGSIDVEEKKYSRRLLQTCVSSRVRVRCHHVIILPAPVCPRVNGQVLVMGSMDGHSRVRLGKVGPGKGAAGCVDHILSECLTMARQGKLSCRWWRDKGGNAHVMAGDTNVVIRIS